RDEPAQRSRGYLRKLRLASAQAFASRHLRPVMEAPITLRVDGKARSLMVDTRTTLLDALLDRLGVTSPKKGCDHGQCGACTVLLDGRRINSCLALSVAYEGAEIVTAVGLAANGGRHPMQLPVVGHDRLQCGYCTPGQLVSAVR